MKLRLFCPLVLLLVAGTAGAQDNGAKRDPVREKFSYSFGMMIGRNLKKQGVDVDVDLLIMGFKDSIVTGKTQLTEEQAMESIQAFEQQVAAQKARESQAFLQANKTKQGVQTTQSGLQYKVVKAGKGPKPRPTDMVTVNYRGVFPNGTEFDSSGGKPFTIAVADVIPGWAEALQLMETGSRWHLFIPPELAYGEQGQPPIGPNAALIFDLELIQVQQAAAPGNGAQRR